MIITVTTRLMRGKGSNTKRPSGCGQNEKFSIFSFKLTRGGEAKLQPKEGQKWGCQIRKSHQSIKVTRKKWSRIVKNIQQTGK